MERYGDFCGFSFNGTHSSSLNILRVSDGSRYNENMIPNFQDTTVKAPGADETYYFNSTYNQKTFSIKIAFDSMTELQYRQFRQVFNGKDMGALIFDESPYKAYSAKLQNAPQLQTICFDSAGGRIYKGEGTLNFVCYNPFAQSVHKWLNSYQGDTSLWAAVSGMKATQGVYDLGGTTSRLYNPGDFPTDWIAFYQFSGNTCALTSVSITEIGQINFNQFSKKGTDSFIGINSKTQLIEGYNGSYQKTGTLYNEQILSGDFFKIPIITGETVVNFESTGASCSRIDYGYIYY